MSNNSKAIDLISSKLEIASSNELNKTHEEKLKQLAQYLDYLIANDFNKLIGILYRIDVSEQKVRLALADSNKTTSDGYIIAQLLVEREIEKIALRQKYSKK